MPSKKTGRFIIITALIATVIWILFYPHEGIRAAHRGIEIWWDILFPSLFPFFVISELLLGFGIVHFFGKLLDPLMRPIFRVPGIGGFAMAMGFASGYPVGARLTSKLWEQKLINREEGERLVSFTSTSDPIFLIGAVSVGFFHQPALAAVFASAHYGAGVLTGILMRFHAPKSSSASADKKHERESVRRLLYNAFSAMHHARLEDGRPLGRLMSESIEVSIRLILVVGGLVVFFSVLLEMMSVTHLLDFLHAGIGAVLGWIGIPVQLTGAVISGIFEVTLGAKASAAAAGPAIHLVDKAAAAAFVLSWSGLSVHAQVVSLLTGTSIRYWPFLIARLIHALLGTVLVYICWPWLGPGTSPAMSRFLPFTSHTSGLGSFMDKLGLWALLCLGLLAISILAVLCRRLRGPFR